MNGIQYSQCSNCKRKKRVEQLLPADSGAMMLCEECYRKHEEEEKSKK